MRYLLDTHIWILYLKGGIPGMLLRDLRCGVGLDRRLRTTLRPLKRCGEE